MHNIGSERIFSKKFLYGYLSVKKQLYYYTQRRIEYSSQRDEFSFFQGCKNLIVNNFTADRRFIPRRNPFVRLFCSTVRIRLCCLSLYRSASFPYTARLFFLMPRFCLYTILLPVYHSAVLTPSQPHSLCISFFTLPLITIASTIFTRSGMM